MMQNHPHDLEKHLLFARHPAAWKMIAPHVRIKTCHKEDAVLHHGDAASALWIVLSGWVKLARQTPDGKETITGLCTHGDVFGEAALFPHASYPYNADVLGHSAELASIPANIIRDAVGHDSALSATVMSLLNERTSQAQLKLEHMSTLSASQRLGCFLLRLCYMQAGGAKTLQIPVEKHVLAAYLGMKPETLSRSQQQLKPLGIAVSGAEIEIESIEKLRDFVCNSCSESGACDVEAAS
ncbi:MAG: Crp/Fnr family transcriptional regulator [Alphaproteobacteria bacterium]|nr:Crp/Fnr family transcriptional regulator [Alphaproteobacteria bacterium]